MTLNKITHVGVTAVQSSRVDSAYFESDWTETFVTFPANLILFVLFLNKLVGRCRCLNLIAWFLVT